MDNAPKQESSFVRATFTSGFGRRGGGGNELKTNLVNLQVGETVDITPPENMQPAFNKYQASLTLENKGDGHIEATHSSKDGWWSPKKHNKKIIPDTPESASATARFELYDGNYIGAFNIEVVNPEKDAERQAEKNDPLNRAAQKGAMGGSRGKNGRNNEPQEKHHIGGVTVKR